MGPSQADRPSMAVRLWAQRRPDNRYDALMRTAPGVEPEESIEEQNELREILADALDSLTEEEQWIYLMLTTVRLSLRFVGLVLGVPKTTLARRRDRIIQKLQEALMESPLVQERMHSYSSEVS
tara:strand:+ start:1182 stop:1553 length:372 start_codon:yes stop_codon:yes gene_type:complete